MTCFPPRKAVPMHSGNGCWKSRCLNYTLLRTIRSKSRMMNTGSYTLVTPQGKLHFAQLRDSILLMI